MIGGPCGRRIVYPNSKVARGWSTTAVRWRIEAGLEPDEEVWCQGERYVLQEEEGKRYYVHSPPPPLPPEPAPTLHPAIRHAMGRQRYWLAQLDRRPP